MSLNRGLAVGIAILAPVLSAGADDLLWRNVVDFPADLETTDAGWSAIRIDGVSYRAAADDFIIEKATRLSRIDFWVCQITDNPLLGIDWYIFTGPKEGPPTDLVAYGSDAPTPHEATDIVNANFGTIYLESTEVSVPLDAGHYFLAFRCVHQDDNKGNGALTTNRQLGISRGWWSFTLQPDGTDGPPWDMMQVFNGQDNEWAFQLWESADEVCYADFNGDDILDLFDFLAYVNAFNNGEDIADCTGDGTFDLFDFLCFVNAFNEGC